MPSPTVVRAPGLCPTGVFLHRSHHILCMDLHSIPKLHNQALSWFGPERHHRFTMVMRFSYKSGNSTALAYDVRTWMKNLGAEELYMPMHLLGKPRALQAHVQLLRFGGVSVTCIAVATGLNTEKGILGKSDRSESGGRLLPSRSSTQRFIVLVCV